MLLRAWPAVIAVMREINPRDATGEAEFLKISVSAFDPQHAGSDPIEYLMKPVLKEMQTRYARYLAPGGVEQTWKEGAAQTAVDTMLRFTLKSARSRRRRRRHRRSSSSRRRSSRRRRQRRRSSASQLR